VNAIINILSFTLNHSAKFYLIRLIMSLRTV